jgi:multiple sugar transport system permease protein/fructooligosaccharide transport system permease protein
MTAPRATTTGPDLGRRPRGTPAVSTLCALAVATLFLAPVLWMAAASLKPEGDIHRDIQSVRSFVPSPVTGGNYAAVNRRTNIGTVLVNTLVVVALIAMGGLLINGPAAFAFARMQFPGRDILFMVLVASIILPLEVIVVPLFMTVQTLVGGAATTYGERPVTLAALSIPFMAKAFNIFLLRQYFLSLPRSLEEAAFLDGVGWWGVFWRIALPNAMPAIVTIVLLDFVVHWNDFLWPLVVCTGEETRTVQLGLGNFFTQPPIAWGAIMAYAVLATVPVMLVFCLGQRWIVRSVAGTGVKA